MIELTDERGEIAAAADASEALLGIRKAGGDPADEHATIAPAPRCG